MEDAEGWRLVGDWRASESEVEREGDDVVGVGEGSRG